MLKRSDVTSNALMLLPSAVLFVGFFAYPLLYVVYTSLFDWNGFTKPVFVGLANYSDLFRDRVFHISARNNVIWVFSLGLLQVGFAALAALILARRPRGWRFLRTVYFLPRVISAVAIALLWQTIYNAEYGALNAFFSWVAGYQVRHNWLGSYGTALPSIIAQQIFYIGYFMIIVFASTTTIPRSFYEAAEMDGASAFQQERYITLPMIRNTLVTSMTLAMAYGMRHFEPTFLMTSGGPGHSTSVLGLMMYKRIAQTKLGDAAAIGTVLVAIGVSLVLTVRRLLRGEVHER